MGECGGKPSDEAETGDAQDLASRNSRQQVADDNCANDDREENITAEINVAGEKSKQDEPARAIHHAEINREKQNCEAGDRGADVGHSEIKIGGEGENGEKPEEAETGV